MKLVRNLLLIALLLAGVFEVFAGRTYVRGYYRKNGTYVSGHYRNTKSSGYSSSYSKSSYTRSTYTKSTYSGPRISVVKGRRPGQGPRAFSKSMKLKKYQQQGGRCAHCGKFGSMSQMDADHIRPYSKGGSTSWSNLQILCQTCNRSKGNRYSH
jgi:hypothetical protein